MMAELEVELARLELSCEEPGAQVTVDGHPGGPQCPGSSVTWMQPGAHAVLIIKAGFHPTEKKLTLEKGAKPAVPLRLYTDAQWTQLRTPWPQWAPWVVVGAGAAVAV